MICLSQRPNLQFTIAVHVVARTTGLYIARLQSTKSCMNRMARYGQEAQNLKSKPGNKVVSIPGLPHSVYVHNNTESERAA